MSETENATTPVGTAEPAKKKGGSKMLIIIILVVILLGGGGGGFYYWRTVAAAAAENDTEKPKSKKETAGTKGKTSKKSSKSDSENEAPDDSAVKKIIELQPFIVNLADTESARYLRLTVTLGVGGESGGESEKPDQLFVTRVRNAMLAVLSGKTSDEILSVEGKTKLRKELLKAAQAASEEPAVEAIYITDFIVQL